MVTTRTMAAPTSPAQVPTTAHHLSVWTLGLLLVVWALIMRHAWVCDDAYITLRTADNWLHGFGLRWNAQERVQAYTHPLWFLLVSGVYALTGDDYLTLVALSGICTAGALWLWWRSCPHDDAVLFLLPLLALSVAFVDFSTSGLENALSHLLLAGLWHALCRAPHDARTMQRMWLWVALAALTRLDSVLLCVPPAAARSWQVWRAGALSWRQHAAAWTLAWLPFILWQAFAWFYYGFPVPNTAYAKLHTGIPLSAMATQGLRYLWQSSRHDPLTSLVVIAALLSAAAHGWHRRHHRASQLAWPDSTWLLGIGLHLLYLLYTGGDFMRGRFLTAPFFAAMLWLSRTSWVGLRRGWTLAPWALLLLTSGMLPNAPVRSAASYDARQKRVAPHGIVDERAFYAHGSALLYAKPGHRLPWDDNVARALQLRQHKQTPTIAYAVGFLGYFAGPNIHIIDEWALTEPLLARLPPARIIPWRVGHYWRPTPKGYLQARRDGTSDLQDPKLAAYWRRLRTVIQAPLTAPSRWRALWQLNVETPLAPVDRERYHLPHLQRIAVSALPPPPPGGAPLGQPGQVVMDGSGVDVMLPQRWHHAHLHLGLAGQMRYEVQLFRGKQITTTQVLGPHPLAQIRTHRIKLTTRQRQRGYDRIRILPFQGKGPFVLASLQAAPQQQGP